MIQIRPASTPDDISRTIADAAALGVLTKMSRRKRLMIRAIEAVMRPLARLRDRSRHLKSSSSEVRRILVLECWNLGDLVMELPFLRNLRIHYPNAHIALLTSPKCAELTAHQGLVDELIIVRVPWAQHYSRWRKYNPFSSLWIEFFRTLRLLRAQEIDLSFSARADIRDNFIMWFAEAERRVGYAFGGGGFLLTDVAMPDLQNPHFSNRWLRLLEALGKAPSVRVPRLQLTASEQESAERCIAERGIQNGEFIIGIHPGARSTIRQWGAENFEKLAQRLQAEFPVTLVHFGDPGACEPVEDGLQERSFCLPLRQFMGVLAQCQLLICNDSGPMHIASALGVPVVAIFGPTQPAWFGPQGKHDRVVIQPGFWCRPCFDYCIFDQPYCLSTISVDSVFKAAEESIAILFAERSEGKRGQRYNPTFVGPEQQFVTDSLHLNSQEPRHNSSES